MATEYRELNAVIKAIWSVKISPDAEIFNALKRAIEEEVKNIEPADVHPVVSGSWIEATDYNGDTYYICPACEDEFVLTDGTLADNHYFFCPNCGADLCKVVEIDQVKEGDT